MYNSFKNTISILFLFLLLFLNFRNAIGQPLSKPATFTHADTLRGSNGIYRQNWDVLKYELTVKPDFLTKTITGVNKISFFDNGVKQMQIDLQEPMQLDSVSDGQNNYRFNREANVYWVQVRDSNAMYKIKPGPRSLSFFFHGKPREAVKAPWDGGWLWTKDAAGNPWMTVACQGLGASVWYPCKDTQRDEPDSGAIQHIIVPDSLVAVANGRLTEKKALGDGFTAFTWEVKNPINNYCIIPYIGKYVHFSEIFPGEKGKLDMDYWVIENNLEKAKKQFADAPRMMKAFEYWFGPYPFYEDGYKLVEAPHLGMEHQSAIAYGNGFKNGYRGKDLSGTGWGLKWDFIIVHESGHEWFANNISSNDIADMWIHESFTNYSETLFTDYYYGHAAGNAYVIGSRQNIENDVPVIGPYGVNAEGSGDMYCKGGNMLHLVRQLVDDDKKFRSLLRGLNKTFYHKTVDTKQVEDYMSKTTKMDLSTIFNQYLRNVQVPILVYKIENNLVSYKWDSAVAGLNMRVKVSLGKKDKSEQWLRPSETWQQFKPGRWYDGKTFVPNENFYIRVKNVSVPLVTN